jgi:hypothetical protein
MLLAASSWFDLLVNGVLFAAALLVAAAVIAIVRRRLRRSDVPTANEQLAHYRALYERGAINQEEFDRLRGVLSPVIHQEVKRANPQGPTGPPAVAPTANAPRPPEPPPGHNGQATG